MPKGDAIYFPDVQSDIDMKNVFKLINYPSTITQFAVLTGSTIWVDHVNGNDSGPNIGTRGRQDKPFLTIQGAIGATGISSGDVIRVGPGTYDTVGPAIIPIGVSLIGSGQAATIIKSSGASNTVIALTSNTLLQDVTVLGTGTQWPISPSVTPGNITLVNVTASGVDTAVLWDEAAASGTSITAFNCRFFGNAFALVMSKGTNKFFNCQAAVTAPNTTETFSRLISTATGGATYWYGGSLACDGATGGGSRNTIFEPGNGLIEVHDAAITSGTTAANNYDIYISGSTGTVSYDNITRTDGQPLVIFNSGGTVTNLSRFALRDNNLSDILSPSTAAHSLGLGTADSPTHTGLTLSGLTGNTLLYDDAGKIVKSATLGSNLSFSGGTLSLTGVELTANKGAASGYAPLDGSSKVPAANLPALSAGTIATTLNVLKGDNAGNAVAATQTGTGSAVLATSPTLVTPVLGVAAATTLNLWTFTTPATGITITGTDTVSYTLPPLGFIGFRDIPNNVQSANYTTVLGDSAKCILHPLSDNNARTFTIDSHTNVTWRDGTVIIFRNMAVANLSVAITTDTMTLMGAGLTGTRTVAQFGELIAVYDLSTTSWTARGTNVT